MSLSLSHILKSCQTILLSPANTFAPHPHAPPCFRIGGAEDNFIFYIEYRSSDEIKVRVQFFKAISIHFMSYCLTTGTFSHVKNADFSPNHKVFLGGKSNMRHEMDWNCFDILSFILISSLEQKKAMFNVKYEIVLRTPYSKAQWGGTVPQEGHNFEFSENDFFHLISYFGPKRHMFFGETALQKKNPRFESNF